MVWAFLVHLFFFSAWAIEPCPRVSAYFSDFSVPSRLEVEILALSRLKTVDPKLWTNNRSGLRGIEFAKHTGMPGEFEVDAVFADGKRQSIALVNSKLNSDGLIELSITVIPPLRNKGLSQLVRVGVLEKYPEARGFRAVFDRDNMANSVLGLDAALSGKPSEVSVEKYDSDFKVRAAIDKRVGDAVMEKLKQGKGAELREMILRVVLEGTPSGVATIQGGFGHVAKVHFGILGNGSVNISAEFLKGPRDDSQTEVEIVFPEGSKFRRRTLHPLGAVVPSSRNPRPLDLEAN